METGTRTVVRSGWVTFAAVIAFVAGLYNVLSGIAAIAEDDATERVQEVLYGIDISAWGWFWLIIGALQLLTSYLIYVRSPVGLVLGVTWAVISAIFTVFIIWTFPIWGLVVLALDMLVIYGLTANADEFGST
jgi:hypothetical protein